MTSAKMLMMNSAVGSISSRADSVIPNMLTAVSSAMPISAIGSSANSAHRTQGRRAGRGGARVEDGGAIGSPGGETSALCDFNHPLAGQALAFEVKIIGIL